MAEPSGSALTAAEPAAAFERYLEVRRAFKPLRRRGDPDGQDRERDDEQDGEQEPRQDRQAPKGPLAGIWHLTPDRLSTLRHWGARLGWARAEDYADPERGPRKRLGRDLRRLLERGRRDLFVAEPDALGGFGIAGPEGRYNDDTLRFYRVFSLLDDARVLDGVRGRATIWQVGAGWGGFAYQARLLYPQFTCLLTAPVEELLLSATYLAVLLPDARLRVFDPARPEAFTRHWERADLAFAPLSAIAAIDPPAVELAVDLRTLDGMPLGEVDRCVRRWREAGARHLLSMCDGPEARPDPIAPRLESAYWRHPMCTPSYLAKRLSTPGSPTFFLGWRRLVA